jgi:hypothetical protein
VQYVHVSTEKYFAVSRLSMYFMIQAAIYEHHCLRKVTDCMRPVCKVSSHFEYLENRSCGLDVTWRSVRGDLIAHP